MHEHARDDVAATARCDRDKSATVACWVKAEFVNIAGCQHTEGEVFSAPQHSPIGQCSAHHHEEVAHHSTFAASLLVAEIFKQRQFTADNCGIDIGGRVADGCWCGIVVVVVWCHWRTMSWMTQSMPVNLSVVQHDQREPR